MGGGGLLLLGIGFGQEREANNIYGIYELHRNSSDPFYTEVGKTRDELYDVSNQKHKTAQGLIIAGSLLLLAGLTWLIIWLVSENKYKGAISFSHSRDKGSGLGFSLFRF